MRLLTIHAAKGLEFEVVIVADAGRDKAPPSADEILALSDGRFGFRVADPVTTKRRGAFDYEEVKAARSAEDEAERAPPLLRGDDPRAPAPDRLRRDRPRARRRCVDADRLGAGTARGRRRDRRRRRRPGRDRAGRRAAARARRPLSRGRLGGRRGGSGGARAGRGAARALRGAGRAARAPGLELPPLVRGGRAAAASRPPAVVHRALDVRAVLVQVLRAVRHRHEGEAGDRRGRGGMSATEVGSAVHELLEQIDLAAPVAPEIEGREDPRVPRVVLQLRSRASRRRARRRAEGAAVHVRARRRPRPRLPRRAPPRRRSCDRRRLQDERARRRVAGGDRRRGLPAPAARVRARLLPCRRGRGRGRLPVPRACRRGRLDDVHARAGRRARGGALGGDRADPGRRVQADAQRLRVLGLPGARSRLRGQGPARAVVGARQVPRSFVSEARTRVGPKRERIRPSSSGSRSSTRTRRLR